MSDLSKDEQAHVRAAMRFLFVRFGTLALMAKALRFQSDTIRHVMDGKDDVSPTMTFRLAGVGVDEMLAGKWPVPGTCPHCGRGP